MDPLLAKQLYDNGSISEDTYNQAVGGSAGGIPSPPNVTPPDSSSAGGVAPAPIASDPDSAAFRGVKTSGSSAPSYPGPLAPPPDAAFAGVKTSGTSGGPIQSMAPGGMSVAPQSTEKNYSSPNDVIPATHPESLSSSSALPMPSMGGAASAPKGPNSLDLRDQQLSGREALASSRAEQEKEIEGRIAEAASDASKKTAFIINQQLADETELTKRRDNMQVQAHQEARDAFDSLQARFKALGEREIDPDRKWKSLSGGDKGLIGLGILAGGFAGGLGDGRFAGKNPALDQLNKRIDQDIEAQWHNIQNTRNALGDESNMVAKKYAADQDMVGFQTAKRLEGWMTVGHRLDSLAQETKDPIIKAQLEKQKLLIDGKVDESRNALQDFRFARLQGQERAAANAAAAQMARTEAMRKEIRDKTWTLMHERGLSQPEAMRQAYAAVTALDINPKAGPLGSVPTEAEIKARWDTSKPGAKEKAAAQEETNALNTEIDNAIKNVDKITKGGAVGKAWSNTPSWVPGSNSAKSNANARDAWNVHVQTAIAAAYKLGTDAAEPKNLKLLEHYAAPFIINATDDSTIAVEKMQSLRTLINEKAAARGAEAPRTDAAPSRPTISWEK